MRLSAVSALVYLAAQAASFALPIHDVGGLKIIEHPDPEKRQLLQNIVCYPKPGYVQVLTLYR